MARLTIVALETIPEVNPGDDLAALLVEAALREEVDLAGADCLVVTQKIVSKAEGRLVRLDPADPLAHRRLIESESTRILRRRDDLLLCETPHGFVCANAGVDLSNVDPGWAALLPLDSDRSARRIRARLAARFEIQLAVVVTDTFGRPWRQGVTDVAIGVAGLAPVADLRGGTDDRGQVLRSTVVAVADEVAAAADLVMGKSRRAPAAVCYGLDPAWLAEGSIGEVLRRSADDLFR
ncbi:MAG: coenzyme F420-0:L-glutamate ligase [Acidimicrobiia bacterium]